jgi:hypothetical protein
MLKRPKPPRGVESRIEPTPRVGHAQVQGSVDDLELDECLPDARVLDHVLQQLARAPIQQLTVRRLETRGLAANLDVDVQSRPFREALGQPRQHVWQAHHVDPRRVDLRDEVLGALRDARQHLGALGQIARHLGVRALATR